MQTVAAFIFLFSLQIISLAKEVTAYHKDDNRNGQLNGARSQLPWEFVYDSTLNSRLQIYVYIKSLSVSAINITYINTDGKSINAEKSPIDKDGIIRNEGDKEKCGYVFGLYLLNSAEINVTLHIFYESNKEYSELVAHGRNISKIATEKINKNCSDSYDLVIDLKHEYDETIGGKDNHVCDEGNIRQKYCVTIAIDTTNDKTEAHGRKDSDTRLSTNHTLKKKTTNNESAITDTNNPYVVFMYVIPPVIVMCVIILVIYICLKTCHHRNSRPEIHVSTELDTHLTANEILYAELSFAPGDSQPSGREKESPYYAEIVGVLKPADENIQKLNE